MAVRCQSVSALKTSTSVPSIATSTAGPAAFARRPVSALARGGGRISSHHLSSGTGPTSALRSRSDLLVSNATRARASPHRSFATGGRSDVQELSRPKTASSPASRAACSAGGGVQRGSSPSSCAMCRSSSSTYVSCSHRDRVLQSHVPSVALNRAGVESCSRDGSSGEVSRLHEVVVDSDSGRPPETHTGRKSPSVEESASDANSPSCEARLLPRRAVSVERIAAAQYGTATNGLASTPPASSPPTRTPRVARPLTSPTFTAAASTPPSTSHSLSEQSAIAVHDHQHATKHAKVPANAPVGAWSPQAHGAWRPRTPSMQSTSTARVSGMVRPHSATPVLSNDWRVRQVARRLPNAASGTNAASAASALRQAVQAANAVARAPNTASGQSFGRLELRFELSSSHPLMWEETTTGLYDGRGSDSDESDNELDGVSSGVRELVADRLKPCHSAPPASAYPRRSPYVRLIMVIR